MELYRSLTLQELYDMRSDIRCMAEDIENFILEAEKQIPDGVYTAHQELCNAFYSLDQAYEFREQEELCMTSSEETK